MSWYLVIFLVSYPAPHILDQFVMIDLAPKSAFITEADCKGVGATRVAALNSVSVTAAGKKYVFACAQI